ncbi:TolC family protein, partial [Candidatus Woesearchaeota archaeon]|nr:TolC family protein [Candidatus Woesearchaeota archaeon]
MKKRIIAGAAMVAAVLTLSSCPRNASGQEIVDLSMATAVDAALTADYGAERSEIQTKIAHERVRRANGNLLPSFSFNTTLETNRDPFMRTQLTQPIYHAADWQLVDQRQAEEERSRVTEEEVRDRVAY